MADNPYAELSTPSSPSGSATPAPGTAQCSVTKKWFPEDELVTFQGQLVSAEGKQILLDRLQTGAEAPNELVRPGVLRRFGCIFLDGIVLIPVILIVGFTMALASVEVSSSLKAANPAQRAGDLFEMLAIVYLFLGAIEVAYFSVLHGWKGKTFGKMVGKLRVINMDGSPISWKKATARAFAYIGWMFLYPLALLSENFLLFGTVGLIVAVWGLTDIILGLADTRMQRTLHDRICGTRVIWEQ